MSPITKIEVARRQLATAIRMHFEGRDAVSVHTLAHAAAEVAMDLCRHRDIVPFFDSHHIRASGDVPAKEIKDAFRRSKNFFKHADNDPNGVLDGFAEEDNDYILFMACYDLALLNEADVDEVAAFSMWFMAWFLTEVWNFIAKILPGWVRPIEASREDQKAGGLTFLASITEQPEMRAVIIGGLGRIVVKPANGIE
jgi:hypothetical protein